MTRRASDIIAERVLAWPGVIRQPHRFGGIEFQYAGKEIGHLHGDRLVDIPFPKAVRDRLVGSGRAKPHHLFPDSGWVSVFVETARDADNAVELLRYKYDLLVRNTQGTECNFPSDP